MSDMQPYDLNDTQRLPPIGDPGRGSPTAQPWAMTQPAMAQPAWQRPTLVTDRRDPGGAVLVVAWVLAFITLGYLLPWAVAATRGKSNHGAIAVVNLFLGWTFIGWIAALVMACMAHQVIGTGGQQTVVVAQQFPGAQFGGPPQHQFVAGPGWYPAPSGQGQQYWDGQTWTENRAP